MRLCWSWDRLRFCARRHSRFVARLGFPLLHFLERHPRSTDGTLAPWVTREIETPARQRHALRNPRPGWTHGFRWGRNHVLPSNLATSGITAILAGIQPGSGSGSWFWFWVPDAAASCPVTAALISRRRCRRAVISSLVWNSGPAYVAEIEQIRADPFVGESQYAILMQAGSHGGCHVVRLPGRLRRRYCQQTPGCISDGFVLKCSTVPHTEQRDGS